MTIPGHSLVMCSNFLKNHIIMHIAQLAKIMCLASFVLENKSNSFA